MGNPKECLEQASFSCEKAFSVDNVQSGQGFPQLSPTLRHRFRSEKCYFLVNCISGGIFAVMRSLPHCSPVAQCEGMPENTSAALLNELMP